MLWSTDISKIDAETLNGATKEPSEDAMAHEDTGLDILNYPILKTF